MIVKFKLQLTEPTAENWVIWKGLEEEIKSIVSLYGATEIEREYDEVNFEKVVILEYDSDDDLCKLLNRVGRLAGKNDLEIDMTEREKLSSHSQDLIKEHKNKYQL
jgi:hypothetical protein